MWTDHLNVSFPGLSLNSVLYAKILDASSFSQCLISYGPKICQSLQEMEATAEPDQDGEAPAAAAPPVVQPPRIPHFTAGNPHIQLKSSTASILANFEGVPDTTTCILAMRTRRTVYCSQFIPSCESCGSRPSHSWSLEPHSMPTGVNKRKALGPWKSSWKDRLVLVLAGHH